MEVPLIRIVSGALSGKTIGRIFFNEEVRRATAGLTGRALDLAGGKSPSYLPLLPRTVELVRTDISASPGVIRADINERLPFEEKSFDAVFLFNALYAAEEPVSLAREIYRVLKPGGSWLLASPFVANEMPEPHDYVRFTAEGLERLCRNAGFSSVEVVRMGERASAAVQILHPFFLFNIVRAIVVPLALLFDACIPRSVRTSHPTPLGYFVIARK